MLTWGSIEGNFKDEVFGNQYATVGFVEIQEDKKIGCNLTIEGNIDKDRPPLFFYFGNWEKNQEAIDIIVNEERE